MSSIKMTVTIDDDHLDHTSSIAHVLEIAGFHVEQVLARGGAIFGSAEATEADRFRKIEGVMDVREAYEYRLPPMDPRIPQ